MSNVVTKFAYRILVTCLGTIFSITIGVNFYILLELVEGWGYIRLVQNIGNWLLGRLFLSPFALTLDSLGENGKKVYVRFLRN